MVVCLNVSDFSDNESIECQVEWVYGLSDRLTGCLNDRLIDYFEGLFAGMMKDQQVEKSDGLTN